MKHILNKRIIKGLIKEETQTKARYVSLGKRYGIKALVKAGKQEGSHAKLFKRLATRKDYPEFPEWHFYRD